MWHRPAKAGDSEGVAPCGVDRPAIGPSWRARSGVDEADLKQLPALGCAGRVSAVRSRFPRPSVALGLPSTCARSLRRTAAHTAPRYRDARCGCVPTVSRLPPAPRSDALPAISTGRQRFGRISGAGVKLAGSPGPPVDGRPRSQRGYQVHSLARPFPRQRSTASAIFDAQAPGLRRKATSLPNVW